MGEPQPSSADRNIDQKLTAILNVVYIRLLDKSKVVFPFVELG
ncbi:hypothetical protein [Gilliamella apicola]